MRIRELNVAGDRYIEFGIIGPRFTTDRPKPVINSTAQPAVRNIIVRIDGVPYAAFHSRKEASAAISRWRGDTDGFDRAVAIHHGPHWPAIVGRAVEILGGMHEAGENRSRNHNAELDS